jgi:hypothetical protein
MYHYASEGRVPNDTIMETLLHNPSWMEHRIIKSIHHGISHVGTNCVTTIYSLLRETPESFCFHLPQQVTIAICVSFYGGEVCQKHWKSTTAWTSCYHLCLVAKTSGTHRILSSTRCPAQAKKLSELWSVSSVNDLQSSYEVLHGIVWEKTLLLIKAAIVTGGLSSTPTDTFPVVHNMIKACLPNVVVWLAMQLYPAQAWYEN